MRIKIIGDNNCARATRHLLRKAGFAVTEFLPADVVTQAPHSGYVITIDLAPAPHPPDPTSEPDHSTPAYAEATAGSPAAALAKADEAAAVAVEFGVLRGLLDLVSPPSLPKMRGASAGLPAGVLGGSRSANGKKWWGFFLWVPFAVVALAGSLHASPRHSAIKPEHVIEERPAGRGYFRPVAVLAAQGQFATGQGPVKITDGTNNLVVDPCKGQTKLYISINQTANTQLVAGTASKKIYICSIHMVVAVATSAALVEGTGSVCATGTAGVSGFGGATAATGWNFAANGGIALGNGGAAVGAEGTSADNLCLFNSGSGQVSGGISYVVQ